MKVIQETGPAPITSGTMDTVDIGISRSREGQLMILNVLSNTLYTDKISAVLREYGCNAFDANVEAGKATTPILVKLPNRIDPTVCIRDYGFGMTEPQILYTFCLLGESTKRSSNAYTGMLGIGSKAGFAYGDSFTVTSFAKGIKTIYNCYRDQGVPKLAKMFTEPTSDPDGVEIKIPVRQQDIAEFVLKAERVFRYFRVRPTITGGAVMFNRNPSEFSGKSWRYIGDGKSVAIMGNVGYDLSASAIGDIGVHFSKFISAGIELDFEIGELEIAANREGLQYRDHTKKEIVAKLRQVAKEMGALFSTKIASAKSEWEAKILYDLIEVRRTCPANRYAYGVSLKDILSGNVTWNGKTITSSRVELGLKLPTPITTIQKLRNEAAVITYHKSSSYVRLQKTLEPEHIAASNRHVLCINDLPRLSPSRVNGFFHTDPTKERLTIFTFTTPAAQAAYMKEYLPDAPYILLSSIAPYVAPIIAGSISGPSVHRNKHARKAFTLNEASTINRYADARSLYWDTTAVDYKDDGGVYVILNGFWVCTDHVIGYDHPEDFRAQVKEFRKAGLLTGPVYGFKYERKDKLGPKWIKLADHLKDQLIKLDTPKFRQELIDYVAAKAYNASKYIDSEHRKLFDTGTPVRTLLDEVDRMLNPNHLDKMELLRTQSGKPWIKPMALTPLPKATVDLTALEAAVMNRYPMFNLVPRPVGATASARQIKLIADYVQLMEK